MPQELQVLRCFKCKIFQVQIVKKQPKWQCKMCFEKQSIKKIFMKSESGRDCRLYVQEMNLKSELCENVAENSTTGNLDDEKKELDSSNNGSRKEKTENLFGISGNESKWTKFVEKDVGSETNLKRKMNSDGNSEGSKRPFEFKTVTRDESKDTVSLENFNSFPKGTSKWEKFNKKSVVQDKDIINSVDAEMNTNCVASAMKNMFETSGDLDLNI